jgi:hypothetical protein
LHRADHHRTGIGSQRFDLGGGSPDNASAGAGSDTVRPGRKARSTPGPD